MAPSSSTILVVDDDAGIRDALRDALEDEGYRVATQEGGRQALAYLRANPLPAVIFLDWNMAPMNAPQFMEELDKEPAFERVPVVLVTADVHAKQKVVTGRYDGVMEKPVDLDLLYSMAARYAA
jgi:CheY-like chemotaxis protein